MIKSIRLLNWRSHQDTNLQFRKGTNLLVGIMGSGKSSVLDGISFALFGTFPALERRKLKLDDLLRLNESEAKVALEFEWNSAAYRTERVLTKSKKGTSSSASLFKDGLLLESGTNAVTSYIEQLLALDYDLFTRAIYSEQNNTDYFLNLDPRRRKQEIDALLGLDRFEDARTNIISVINRIRSNRKVLEERFSPERKKELEEKGKELQKQIDVLTKKAAALSSDCEKERVVLTEAQKKFAELKGKKEGFDNATRERHRISGSRESLKAELHGKEISKEKYLLEKGAYDLAVQERSAVLEMIRKRDAEFSSLSKEAGQLESRIKSLEEDRKKLGSLQESMEKALGGKPVDALREDAAALEREYIALNSEKGSLQGRIKDTEEALHALKPGSAECPLCGSELTEGHISNITTEKNTLIAGFQERIRQIELLLPQRKSSREGIVGRVRDAELAGERIKQLASGQAELPPTREARAALDSRLMGASAEKASLSRKAEEMSASIQGQAVSVNQHKALLEKKGQLEILEKKLGENEALLRSMVFDEKTFEESRQLLEDARIRSERLNAEAQAVRKELESTNQMVPLVKKELEGLSETEKLISSKAALEEELSIFRGALLETQTSLRSSLTDAINQAMGDIWAIFYPYHNYPALRLSVTEKDYLFQVYDGSVWRPLESIASGGERASAALTLRVALAMVLTPTLSWLILDEPTHNLDREAILLLSETLQLKVPEVVNQTFVITHEEALMGSEFASSYRLKRDKEHNGPTKAEEM
ncbi:MAG: SMC family ATPase [Candidatus Micrarchaeota archaeon]